MIDTIASRASATDAQVDEAALRAISTKVRWLSTAIIDTANHDRPNTSGIKVGGHQASCASMVDIMVALWFHDLTRDDRISVKPHASPALHAINYLLGDLDSEYLSTLRAKGGLQSYPSRAKDPDAVDFSTGSVGIGATAPIWAALSNRYLRSHFPGSGSPGRFISLLGDAELDEGAVWEAVSDPSVARLGELLWVVDLNRQSLDRVVPDIQISRMEGMFAAAGWQTITLKWGRELTQVRQLRGGEDLVARLEGMPNEEYQRLLRAERSELRDRVLGSSPTADLTSLVTSISPERLAALVRDLGGHDIGLLVDTFGTIDTDRPTVVFAYTIKGRELPTEGHPNNHGALLSEQQMAEFARASGADPEDRWAAFESGSPEDLLCRERAALLARTPVRVDRPHEVPAALDHPHRKPISTQAALGRLLSDLTREAPQVAERIVTCSPDVASTTNLGGWINKTGIWSPQAHRDWFADDPQRVLRWSEDPQGQHVELGIAEVNLVSTIAELGATWSRWGERLIPIGVLYDCFLGRALEPWSYGIYAGGQSILVGTPSGVTLAPEGGAHQSITTPSIGLEQPRCIAWEPAFATDLEWCMLHAMNQIGVPGGTSAYFRLSTRPIDQSLAAVPEDPALRERRRRQAVAGGYRLGETPASADDVTLVGVGVTLPEVLRAAQSLEAHGLQVGVVNLTSPDLVFRALQQRGSRNPGPSCAIVDELFPAAHPAPLVTVQDGHPHTLAFLAGARGDRIRCLGVDDFGQSSSVDDAYSIHGIDITAIIDAALTLAE